MPADATQLSLLDVLQRSNASAEVQATWQSAAARAGLLQAALGVVDRAAAVFGQLPSYSELFAPAVQALTALQRVPDLPQVCAAVLLLTCNVSCQALCELFVPQNNGSKF